MIYENSYIYIEKEDSTIPWLKIFAKEGCKEMSQCDPKTKEAIWLALDIIERQLIDYYNPIKINIASFGNYHPEVHWHIMARFEDDSHYPEPMWGKRQRDGKDYTEDFDIFLKRVKAALEEGFALI